MQEKLCYEKFERQRVDSYLASIYKDYSRSYFQTLNRDQKIFVNGVAVQSSYKLQYGDTIVFEFKNDDNIQIVPENIKIDIMYEDEHVIIVNKQAGIVVHPSYGHTSGTLLNALVAHANSQYKPFLVHRLDKDTSGAIIFAKNEKSKISISKQLQNRAIKKIYYTAVNGIIVEDKGYIEAPIGRSSQNRKLMSVNPLAKKMAITEFKVISRRGEYTLLEVRIITGRTHQIRSHMKYINHPVIGDCQYGGPKVLGGKTYNRQMLHAYSITFTHPFTTKRVNFIAPLPKDILEIFESV